MSKHSALLNQLSDEITRCELCPRLRKHCIKIADQKRRAYQNEVYWGKPISGFGDPNAQVVIVGLAPGSHGANRTGRVFTGDRSGEWLYRALNRAGFANQAESNHLKDGLRLKNVYITCVVKCAPPENKPDRVEIKRCSYFLDREAELLNNVRVWIALGGVALQGIWPKIGGTQPRPKFKHGATVDLSAGKSLILSYHPSQQNTFTGRLTEKMFDQVFRKASSALTG